MEEIKRSDQWTPVDRIGLIPGYYRYDDGRQLTILDVGMADILSAKSTPRQNPHRDRLGGRHMRLQCVVP